MAAADFLCWNIAITIQFLYARVINDDVTAQQWIGRESILIGARYYANRWSVVILFLV